MTISNSCILISPSRRYNTHARVRQVFARRDSVPINVIGKTTMIRPDFRKRLMDQRGAAVILWSLFMMSVALYLVIARNVLNNPKFAAGLSLAETARILLWGLAVVDLGY